MASGGLSEMDLKCAICVDVFKEPRKLLGCSHLFCGECLLTYILNLKLEDSLVLEFPCPVCKQPTLLPDDNEITIEWIQTLDMDSGLESKVKQNEINENLCCRCKYIGKQITSKVYCLTCKEHLCSSCSEILHASEGGGKHALIGAERADKTNKLHGPALKLLNQILTCPEHVDKPVELYCELHNDFICYMCSAKKHANCRSLKEIKEISKSSVKAESDNHVEAAEELKDHMKLVIGVHKENEVENTQNVQRICKQFTEIKQKIIQLLDTVEENINQETRAMAKHLIFDCLNEVEKLKEKMERLNILIYVLKNCLTDTSDEQAFVCIRKLWKIFQDVERDMVQNEKNSYRSRIELKSMKLLDDLLNVGPNETSQIANVKEKVLPVSLPCYRDRISQRNHRVEKISAHTVRPRDSSSSVPTYNISPAPTYNILLYLPGEKMLLIDSDFGYCCLVNEQCKEMNAKKFVRNENKARNPFKRLQFATFLESSRLIVLSLTNDKKICFVSPDDLNVKGEIMCSKTPKAICALDNYNIAISWEDPVAFGIISLLGVTHSELCYFTADKSGRQLKSFDFMAVDVKRRSVIQPCKIEKAVYCFSFDGRPIFTFKNEELKEPRGVAVSSNGIIFVCNKTESGSIYMLSQNGQLVKIIKEQCPSHPLGIAVKDDHFAVSQADKNWDEIHFFTFTEEDETNNTDRGISEASNEQ